jgi:hypothetical protein
MIIIENLDKALNETYLKDLKDPKNIIMNSKTLGIVVYELTKLYPGNIINPTGKFYYRGIEIIKKEEIQNGKFLIL